MIKDIEMGFILDYPSGPNIITCSLQGKGRRVRVKDRNVTREAGGWCNARQGQQERNVGSLQKLEDTSEKILS